MDTLDKATLANVDEKGFVPDEVRNAFFRKLRMKSENRSCFECNARNPTWNSLTYGVYLCLECSGEHRRKGVHISFVRSVELDRFTPEQMLQMGVGGNGKAWQYFKASGMGKTSDSGRAVDYNSKICERYKQQMEKETAAACEKFGVVPKAERSSNSVPDFGAVRADGESPTPAPEPVSISRSVTAPSTAGSYPQQTVALSTASATSKAPPVAPVPAPAAMPKSTAPASNIKVLGGFGNCSPAPMQTMGAPAPTPTVSSTGVPKASGFVAKQKAKEIDFDFDFDELEKEASKPTPAPAPKAVSAPVPKPAASFGGSTSKPVPAAASAASTTDKFNKAKAISSADFFNELEGESTAERVEREGRFNKFAGAGAISSSSFFENGEQQQDPNDGGLGSVASRGLSKGAEMLTTYLNKVRD